jgi:Raf kinase inhibitor-like YbhB/YbcL family protein
MEATQMKISSPAFPDKGAIPAKHTCDGPDTSPPLSFESVPAESQSLALVVDDPDAPTKTWVHWVVWNIEPKARTVAEGAVPEGGVQGMNDFNKRVYGGPCPPSGTHRYFFKLYALDTRLDLGPDTTKAKLESAMQGHILARAETVGTYSRQGRR